MTELRHPEAPGSTVLHGINDAETIVGVYTPGQNQDDAATFTFANNRFSRFDCFESAQAPPPPPDPELPASGPSLGPTPPQSSGPRAVQMTALNNQGAMVGSRWTDGLSRAFFTKPITFADPMGEPWLALPGGTVTQSHSFLLARRGRPVQAIAADGASQILIRIPVATIGESVTVSIYKTKTQQANNGGVAARDSGVCHFMLPGTV